MDPDKLKEMAKRVFGAMGGATTAAMIYLGERLGLYRAMAGAGALTSRELAEKTGLDERWLREWQYQQGAAGILEYRGDGRFALSEEGGAVLADESHPAFGAGFFSHLPQQIGVVEKLPEAFRTGVGLPYDALGPEGAAGIERGLAGVLRTLLVPVLLPRLPGVVARLEAGGAAADIGCGTGLALIEMAKAYPKAQFHGWDISRHALERAEWNRHEAGTENVSFHDPSVDPLPGDARFDLITTFDCLHDMTDPVAVMRSIRGAIRPDGAWLVVDIKAHETYEQNVERNPMAPMMYGLSVLSCMSSALSEPGGAGLGTLGFHEKLAERMTREAGFRHFERLDLKHPVNAFYLVRP
jgi:SAM-dependent methyltransferase